MSGANPLPNPVAKALTIFSFSRLPLFAYSKKNHTQCDAGNYPFLPPVVNNSFTKGLRQKCGYPVF
jgi:hypothetical protein